jgi:signal transduction histidine kinase
MKAKTPNVGEIPREGVPVLGPQDTDLMTKVMQASELACELGTPLNVLSGRVEGLITATQEEQTRRGLEVVLGQAERLTQIRAQLLELLGQASFR